MNNQIAVFEQRKIRHSEYKGEMFFSVVDVIEALTDPELGFDRLREIYQAKGYTDEWIKQRLQTIAFMS